MGGGRGGGVGGENRSKYVDAPKNVVDLESSTLALVHPRTPDVLYHAVVSDPVPTHGFAYGMFREFRYVEHRELRRASNPVRNVVKKDGSGTLGVA